MTAAVLLLAAAVQAAPVSAPAIPDNPAKLVFKPLTFTPPQARDHRVVLSSGMVVFIAEDRTLPLVSLSLIVRTGAYLDPAGKEGLATLVGSQIRNGGTRTLTAEQLDERLDYLAARVETSIGETAGTATLNCLAENLDDSLKLFVEMLKEPRFQEDRLALAREQALQEMSRRNDDPEDIERREWNVLLYGEGRASNRFTTEASVRSVSRADLVAFHDRYFHPAGMIAAVSGAFSRPEMIRKLEAAFAGWPGARPQVPPVPSEVSPAAPGLYRIEKQVPQGRVSIGLPAVKRDSPDIYALEVMNEILGGSGFVSRITRTVRSNEGLAYSAGSALRFGIYYPGAFRALFQSKSRTVAWAAQLVMDEIKKMREEPVTAEELDTIKRSLIETFPGNFESKAKTVALFAADEYTGRDPSFWQTYRDRIQAVPADDVQRVARQYVPPEKLLVLVVGDQKEIDVGDGKHAVALAALAPGGHVVTLPLRDPMTMKLP